MDPKIEILKGLKPQLRERFGVTGISVFGSRVRGEARPDSDLDIILDFERTPSFFDLSDLDDFLVKHVGVQVDTQTRRSLHPGLRESILAEAIAL